jgi:predicted GIY-YIG superfamily endonuclease
MKYYIYNLICPLTGKVKYVGCTKNPKTRHSQHVKDSFKNNTEKQKWIQMLLHQKREPTMKVVAEFDNEVDARKAEENECIKHIDTILNIHMPGKGSRDISFYKKTGKTK